MSLPISFPHTGAPAYRFLCKEEERRQYALAQEILKEQAILCGQQVIEYPKDLQKLGPVYLHEMEGLKEGERGRSLHAATDIQPNQLLATFEGCIQTQEEFDEAHPIIGEGRVITIPFGALRKSYDKGAEEQDYVVRESHPSDHAGMLGQICHKDLEKLEKRTLKKADKVRFTFIGWRMTEHTLTLSKGKYINPLIKVVKADSRLPALKKGKRYILGLGTMANTNDKPFGDGTGNNAELVGVLEPMGAYLVSTGPIKKDQEIRTSYRVRRIFKDIDELRRALEAKTAPPLKARSSVQIKKSIYKAREAKVRQQMVKMVLRDSTKRQPRV